LTIAQDLDLTIGNSGQLPPPFRSDAERRKAWQRHREVLLAQCQGRRPQAWWQYESPIPRPADRDYEAATLYEANLLSDRERELLLRKWHVRFEEVFTPWFERIGYFTGERWLMGEEGRQAHHKWAGIPPKLVRQWTLERKRHERTIAKLQAQPSA
jgi:hypothetical protein